MLNTIAVTREILAAVLLVLSAETCHQYREAGNYDCIHLARFGFHSGFVEDSGVLGCEVLLD